jgi:two-component system sensor histidine kinase UhpB
MIVLPTPFFAGIPFLYYGVVSPGACSVVALVRHIHQMSVEIQRTTEYSLVAHRRERNRLARDLHDGLGQMLALLKMQMQRMGKKHAGDPVQEVFDESADQVGGTLDELRRIARDLRPAPMQDRSFGFAVREYAAAIEHRTDLTVNVSGEFSSRPGDSIADELYRIAQECLTNCLKHSGARNVDVVLAEVGDRYLFTVDDDGRGLSGDVPPGLGLATIRERAQLLGGTCSIASESDAGTRVEVSIPRRA